MTTGYQISRYYEKGLKYGRLCDVLGNSHQINKGDANCPLCGVNLLWD